MEKIKGFIKGKIKKNVGQCQLISESYDENNK
jgi:hypothetical protein